MTEKEFSPAKRALLEKWLQGRQSDKKKPSIPLRPPSSPHPLSFPQQRQLFLELLERGTAVNNLSVFIRLKGPLNLSALEKSTNQILARHDSLRTSFSFAQGLPAPHVWEQLLINIPIVSLLDLEVAQRETEARRLAETEVLQPFDLSLAPLIRLKIYRADAQEHLLLVVIHHTIADGWSLGIFLKELMAFYQAKTTGQPVRLPELPLQYADFAYWQTREERQAALQPSLAYWKEQLGGELPVLELPTDQQRSARRAYAGGTYRFVISRDLTEALEQLSRQENSTLFTTLLTAFYILLHRYSGQDDISIGTPVANRNSPEEEELIGIFINTLVLRTSLSGDLSSRELLQRVRRVSLDAFVHQDLPFEKLVEALKPRRDLSRTPLFQVMFNLQSAPMPQLEMDGLEASFINIDRGTSQFDLTLMVSKTGGQCHATVEYNTALFQPATIARMFQSYQMLLKNALDHPDRPVSKLPCIPPDELHRTVHARNQTQLHFPKEKCFHQLFEAQVEATPDDVAVIYDQRQVTYGELNRRANALARHLRELGVGPEVRVGIYMKRSWEMLAAFLGILKAGGTYVPLHTSFPAARLLYMLKDAHVKVLLTNLEPALDAPGVRVVSLKEVPFPFDGGLSNPAPLATPAHLAYVIYTSGSTGNPKGVMINHSSLVNFLWSMYTRPGIKQDDVLLAVTSVSFDIAALELFLPLIAGATVVLASEEQLTHPHLLAEAIDYHQVRIMQATPAIWQVLLETGWTGRLGLKALCGGDVLTLKLADQLLDRVGSLWNMYGPTETTIWSSAGLLKKGDAPVTIGQPIGNTQLYILDCYNQPTPVNVVGELHIGGGGLARGYLNLPHLTDEKFIQISVSSQPDVRLYRTGDRARYLADGSIEILGRTDDQEKINGHRVEPGEITAILLQHPAVQDAIVIARTESSGDKRLVAYLVSKDDPSPEACHFREFLGKKLPAYMIPSSFVRVHSLPLTPNGKINRKALPVPEDVRPLHTYIAPRNEEEQLLAEIWQHVLKMEQVGIHDNFFDLGGASLQSLQVIARANMYGLRVSVENIFEHQTIAELAASINGTQSKG
ncbi:amino acid adenylation domain-containing protein [Pontibacter diazotrophicus]|uniref:Amino acid adenylation domain-containing protein n=1 Tax=Pontibacter diazotrophicus TaxID=1400979 RepID=A0A3D8LEK3_9BACT|nr:non-ribosomal peptide synthetase [Pontibacter diazotrophicus]RDV15372.1 amino acid adenylation domain-containing protein [Pontibacter diazotrophicus]